MPDPQLCACVAPSPYECWARRYSHDRWTYQAIEYDGGPCECACHDDWYEDDYTAWGHSVIKGTEE